MEHFITVRPIQEVAARLPQNEWARYAKMPERYRYAVVADGWPTSIHMTLASAEERCWYVREQCAKSHPEKETL